MRKIDILLRSILCLTLFYSISLAAQSKSSKPSAAQEKSTKAAPAEDTPKYKNAALAIDDRVADLLSRMTLEEKVGQITPRPADQTSVIDPTGTYTDASARAV